MVSNIIQHVILFLGWSTFNSPSYMLPVPSPVCWCSSIVNTHTHTHTSSLLFIYLIDGANGAPASVICTTRATAYSMAAQRQHSASCCRTLSTRSLWPVFLSSAKCGFLTSRPLTWALIPMCKSLCRWSHWIHYIQYCNNYNVTVHLFTNDSYH